MSKTQSKSAWKNLFCGGVAGGVEVCINYPTEFVKTQLQLYGKDAKVAKFNTPMDVVKTTLKEKGPLGLYRGLMPLFFGSIPKAAVRFGANAKAKELLRDENGKLSFGSTILAGLAAGVSESILAVTPMETIKTKLIHDQGLAQPRYRNAIHGIKTMLAEEGIRGIYAGLAATTMKQGCNQMVRFTVYDTIKTQVKDYKGDQNYKFGLVETFGYGAVAGFISVYATMPFDVVKTRMQGLEATKYKNTLDCAMQVVKNDGVVGLWKGTTPRLARVALSTSIIFTVYEQVMGMIGP